MNVFRRGSLWNIIVLTAVILPNSIAKGMAPVSEIQNRIGYLTRWYAKWLAPTEWKENYKAQVVVPVVGVLVNQEPRDRPAPPYLAIFATDAELTFFVYLDENSQMTKYRDSVGPNSYATNAEALKSYLSVLDRLGPNWAGGLADSVTPTSQGDPHPTVPSGTVGLRDILRLDKLNSGKPGSSKNREDTQQRVLTFDFQLPYLEEAGSALASQTDLDALSALARNEIINRGWVNACSGPTTVRIPRFSLDDPEVFGLIENKTCGAVLSFGRLQPTVWKLNKFYPFNGAGRWTQVADQVRDTSWDTFRIP